MRYTVSARPALRQSCEILSHPPPPSPLQKRTLTLLLSQAGATKDPPEAKEPTDTVLTSKLLNAMTTDNHHFTEASNDPRSDTNPHCFAPYSFTLFFPILPYSEKLVERPYYDRVLPGRVFFCVDTVRNRFSEAKEHFKAYLAA